MKKAVVSFSDGFAYIVEYSRYKDLMKFMIEYVDKKPFADKDKRFPVKGIVGDWITEGNGFLHLSYANGKICWGLMHHNAELKTVQWFFSKRCQSLLLE